MSRLKLLHRLITHRPQTLATKPEIQPQVRVIHSVPPNKPIAKKKQLTCHPLAAIWRRWQLVWLKTKPRLISPPFLVHQASKAAIQ